jgi:uncharacterized protein YkwD
VLTRILEAILIEAKQFLLVASGRYARHMSWASIISLSLQLAAAIPSASPAKPADTAAKSSWRQVSPCEPPAASAHCDSQAERQLLELANSDRAQAGLPPLKMDDGLVRAARAHAAEMASERQLSHQFSGEPGLNQRIAAASKVHLDRAGENVAVAATPDQAHTALMASPPHRDNLLSRNFNVAGMIYIAQDFGSSSPSYSVQQASALVSKSVEQLRAQARMPRLQLVDSRKAQSSACTMAKADSLNAAAPPAGAYMLRYTSMHPEVLPTNISKVIAQRGLHTYSTGTCYAQRQKYPNGAYWVVLVFY